MSSGHADPRAWPQEDLESQEACPLCESEDRTTVYRHLVDRLNPDAPGDWSLHRCRDCSCAWIDPRPTAETIGRTYGSYYTHTEPGGTTDGFGLRLLLGYIGRRYGYSFPNAIGMGRWLVPLIPGARGMAGVHVRDLPRPTGPARLLDVGAANGEFLLRMRALGWEVAGLEPDPVAASLAQAAGFDVLNAQVSEDAFPPASFDAITLGHVAEHLHDPVEVFSCCYRWLRPGGRLWIATPNVDSAMHDHFGQWWSSLDPPRHLVLFSRRSLVAALRRVGFEEIDHPVHSVQAYRVVAPLSDAFRRGLNESRARPSSFSVCAAGVRADLRGMWDRDTGDELIVAGVRR